ncbi:MAG: hypothetical protein MUF51_04375 [Vicinamibacteria bacterium]|nr:hypothetical protein [Vicinamibacteria bacterium]
MILGGAVGGVAWFVWASLVNFVWLMPKYVVAQEAGLMLKAPRYGFFPLVWMLQFFAFATLIAALYAGVRATWGAGPWTALRVGVIVGLAAGYPVNFYTAAWVPFTRIIPAGWLIELLCGAILAALIAGRLYKDA